MRIGTTERRACTAALEQHRLQGRLDDAEYRTRVRRVEEAVHDSDLAGLFDDLPGGSPVRPAAGTPRPEVAAQAEPGLAPFAPREPGSAYVDSHPDTAPVSSAPSGAEVASTGAVGSSAAGTAAKTSGVAPRTPDGAWRKFLATPFVAIAATAGFFLTEGWSHSWVWFLAIPFSIGLSGFLANRGAGRRGGLLLMTVMFATAMGEIMGDMGGRSWLWYLLIPLVVMMPMPGGDEGRTPGGH